MVEKNKGGRPPALVADEPTLKIIKGLGQIQATTKECAAVLGVSERTFITFRQKNLTVADAYEHGSGEGLASLRRRQFQMAEKSATMAIWLGKQYLGQSDCREGSLPIPGKKEIAEQNAASAGEGTEWGDDLAVPGDASLN